MTRTAYVLRIVGLFVTILSALTILAATTTAQNAVPFVNQPLVPDTIAPGGPGFTLTVNGTGFVPASTVHWNGSPRATTFIHSSQLTATILASDIATASTAAVTVVSPTPGGGSSIPVFFPIATPETFVSFSKTDFSTPGGNVEIVTADFNGDGNPDLAIAGFYVNEVTIFLGNGDGKFSVGQSYPASGAHGIAVGDFNGDGKPDLVVTSFGSGVVSIFLGNGDGTFTVGGTFSTGGICDNVYSVAVGDFNSDGKLDLVAVDNTSNNVSVLLGNGDGTFQPHVDYDSGNDSRKVVTGDFNRDGHLDFAVSGSDGISVLLGKGDGTFQPKVVYPLATSDNPYLLTADLNGDGKLDLVVANTAGSATVMLGKGDGTFESGVRYSTGGYSAAVAAADFNGDGVLDLLTTNYYTSTISLLPGHGDGTFGSYVGYRADSGARGIAVADFNRDGRLDVAVGNQFVDSVSVFLQTTTKSPTSTTFVSSLNPSIYGQKITFTARVTTTGSEVPTGTVAFTRQYFTETYTIGSATLNSSGVATLTKSNLNADSYPLRAAYKGDTNNLGSTSPVLNQVVKQTTSSATITSSLNPSTVGQAVTFAARLTSPTVTPTGPVTFTAGTTVLGTAQLSGGKAAFTTSTLPVGSTMITVTYQGDSNITKSSASVTQTVH